MSATKQTREPRRPRFTSPPERVRISASTLAECIELFDDWAGRIDPHEFNPLVGIKGGTLILSNIANELNTFLVGDDWVRFCTETGAGVKNSILCWAANYDLQPGMVACALEVALWHKIRNRLPKNEFIELILQVYGNDWAALYTLTNGSWGRLKEGLPLPPRIKTRSLWRQELKHDVLIHPATLEPCRHVDGTPLVYEGLVDIGGGTQNLSFIFPGRPGKAPPSSMRVTTFPSVA